MAIVTDEMWLQIAAEHDRAGRLSEAEAIYREMLNRLPGNTDLQNAIGVLAYRTRRAQEARQWIGQAVAANPMRVDYLNNLGLALQELGEFEQAAASFNRALQIDPSGLAAAYNFGIMRASQRLWTEAVTLFRHALRHHPHHIDTWLELGIALNRSGEIEEAIAIYREGLVLHPNQARLWNNLGNALNRRSDLEAAEQAFCEALRCNPTDALAANNLGNVLVELGRLDEALASVRQSMALNPASPTPHSNLIFFMQLHPEIGSDTITAECHRWWERHGVPLKNSRRTHENDRISERRLRIGYVSPDFRTHASVRHMLPAIEAHNPSQFELVLYSVSDAGDTFTERFRKASLIWHDAGQWTDERLAAQIRTDRIDILIDLSLHAAGNRLPVFAREPAPLQASFAGYPGSTGLETIRHRITDRFLDPPGSPESFPGEEFVRLPESFWCFDPLGPTPEVNPAPVLEKGVVTLGCLGKFAKVNDPVLGCWAAILLRVPQSRLLLLCPAGEAQSRVRTFFARRGVAAERVIFTDRLPRDEYLRLHHRIDLALDPFPYNSHMTSCDALWMGVPFVSLAGSTPVSRGGLSLLSTVGLPELVAFTHEDYVRLAADLASDPPRLAELRDGMRARMQSSPLMDAPQFARGLEAAYRAMWQRWCASSQKAPR